MRTGAPAERGGEASSHECGLAPLMNSSHRSKCGAGGKDTYQKGLILWLIVDAAGHRCAPLEPRFEMQGGASPSEA